MSVSFTRPDFQTPHSRMVDATLLPAETFEFTALDLFAGCGGLALGFEAAGFRTIGFEMDQSAVQTYTQNLKGECHVAFLQPGYTFPQVDIVIGGPPCQPFSVGGLQRGLQDSRDGFPVFIDAVRRLKPAMWMFENVRGMMYRNREYLGEILHALFDLGYQTEVKLLNASDFQVPQNRERLIAIGHRGNFAFPAPCPTNRITVGEALGALAQTYDEDSAFLTPTQDAYIARYEEKSKCVTPRDLHLDRVARTLTCRNLAGSTSDMHRVKLQDGRRRRITVREAARLQSFPDWFEFSGSQQSQFQQIGNAVAPMFGKHIALAMARSLRGEEVESIHEEAALGLFEVSGVRWR